MSNFVFRINGVDVSDSVIIRDAVFTSAAKGAAGSAEFRLRDEAHLYQFATGDSLVLRVDGEIVWGGYVAKIERGYFFEADCRCKTHTIPRYLKITGTDYNVLLNKRVLYDPATPTDMELRRYAAGTYDDTILTYYLENYTDLAADGITFGMIERVGIPQTDDFFSGSPSWTVNQFMQTLTSEQLGSIWYIDPEQHFVYTDVDTPNALYGLSDDPGTGQVGYREAEFDFDGSQLRNDVLAWGVGQGAMEPVFFRSQDPTSQAEHGVWQEGSMSNNVWHQDTIERIARSYVFGSPQNHRGGKDDRISVKCSVFEPSFRVAQKVVVESETFDFEDVIPIRYQRITFPSHESVRFDLVLAHDIDEPWTTLEFWWPDWDIPDWKPPIIQLPEPPVLPPNDPCDDEEEQCELLYESSGAQFLPEASGDPTPPGGFILDGASTGIVAYTPDLYVAPLESAPFGWTSSTSINTGLGISDPFSISGTIRIDSTWAQTVNFWNLSGSGNEGVGFNVTSGINTYPLARWYSDSNRMTAGEMLLFVYGEDKPQLGFTPWSVPTQVSLSLFANETAYSMDWDGVTLNFMVGGVSGVYTAAGRLASGIGGFGVNQSVQSSNRPLAIPSVTTYLTFISTELNCQPCIADPPISQRVCENLTRIATPANSSDDWAYFQASSQMAFGSDEVWLDGLRVDSRDYTMHGLRDIVAFYDKAVVGGTDPDSDPPKTVHACYISALIGVV